VSLLEFVCLLLWCKFYCCWIRGVGETGVGNQYIDGDEDGDLVSLC
jgi:hypothetical protein